MALDSAVSLQKEGEEYIPFFGRTGKGLEGWVAYTSLLLRVLQLRSVRESCEEFLSAIK